MARYQSKAMVKSKRKNRRNRKYNIPIGVPSSKIVKFKYVDSIILDPPQSGIQAHYFSANGLYDPDVSGIGHQPRYFDSEMLSYDHYMVIGSKIKVTSVPYISHSTADGLRPCVWGVTLQDTPTLSDSTPTAMIEGNRNKGRWRLAAPGVSGENTKGKYPSITCGFSAKKFLGDLSDKHEGTKSANPSDQAYYGIWCGAPAPNVDPGNFNFMVEIVYTAILKEPAYVAQS